MRITKYLFVNCLILFFFINNFSFADSSMTTESFKNSFSKCLREGKVKGKFRARHEYVNDSSKSKNANALTFSGNLGYDMVCGEDEKLRIFVEMQGNWAATNSFNSLTNGHTDYPVVPDPSDIQLNNAFASYQFTDWLHLKGGRMEKKWGDASLIGDVKWRNLGTSFDGIQATITPDFLADTSIEVDYMGNWTNPLNKEVNMDTVLGRVVYSGFENSELSGHVILLDFNDENYKKASTATYGVAYWVDRPIHNSYMDNVSARLDLAGDVQHDYSENPDDYTVLRTMVRGTLSVSKVSFYVGHELLSSDDGQNSFQRQLATLHLVNGWADQFLRTPAEGLNDTEIGMLFKDVFSGKFKISGHFFNSHKKNIHYGNEIDASYSYPLGFILPEGSAFVIKLAHFFGDKTSDNKKNKDVTKLWGQLQIPFSF